MRRAVDAMYSYITHRERVEVLKVRQQRVKRTIKIPNGLRGGNAGGGQQALLTTPGREDEKSEHDRLTKDSDLKMAIGVGFPPFKKKRRGRKR